MGHMAGVDQQTAARVIGQVLRQAGDDGEIAFQHVAVQSQEIAGFLVKGIGAGP